MLAEMSSSSQNSDEGGLNPSSRSESSPIAPASSTMVVEQDKSRPTWDNKLQFLLATIGFAVGLGNVWRFPYMCYKNGGGAFLIPYIVMLLIEGIPLLYLELSVGQRLRKGSVKAWSMVCQHMGGIGLASLVICILTASYYSVVISWFLYYMFSSLRSTLPWAECPVMEVFNFTSNRSVDVVVPECGQSNSVLYFFFRKTLNVSESINQTTTLNWKILLCYITIWIIVYISIIKGIKSSGKVVYFTATFPYLVLTAFFIRGLTIEGFDAGLRHLFTPQWGKLADPVIWMEAAAQVFYSTGLAFGCILAFASYNPIHNNTLKDAVTISLINSVTSLFASIVVFSILGFRATLIMKSCEEGLINPTNSSFANRSSNPCDFDKFLKQAAVGPSLVFIAFSDAMRHMPAAPVWSVLFFLMCLTLGIDSLFGGLESVSASLNDLKRFSNVKIEYISGGICITCFLLGLSMVQDSAFYVVQLFDKFSANMALLVIAIFEFISVSWIYGYQRFSEDIHYMTGSKPHILWKACWTVVSPCLIVAILISSFVKIVTERLTYDTWSRQGERGSVKYPPWALFLGIAMTMVSVMFIPVMGLLRYLGVPLYTKEYPPPISGLLTATQTLIVNRETGSDVNRNKSCQRNGNKPNGNDVETFL